MTIKNCPLNDYATVGDNFYDKYELGWRDTCAHEYECHIVIDDKSETV